MSIVYSIRCLVTNKIVYIGSTSRELSKRLIDHRSAKNIFNSPVNKFFRASLQEPAIEMVEDLGLCSKYELEQAERFWIEQFRQWGFSLLNASHNLSPSTPIVSDIQLKTESVRINKDLFRKIKLVSKIKGQTISGYIEAKLNPIITRQSKLTQ